MSTLELQSAESIQSADDIALQQHERRRFTVEEYDQMSEAGVFVGKPRTELIDGEILTMPAMGNAHSVSIQDLYDELRPAFPKPWFIRTQSTHRLSTHLAPEPDLALLRAKPVARAKLDELPVLVVEISDTTLAFDLGSKRMFYARSDVPEYWVIDLKRRIVHIFREPNRNATSPEDAYGVEQIVDAAGELRPLAGEGKVVIRVADFVPAAGA